MKRLRLASKLSLAIVPIGLVALLAGGFVAWTFAQRTTAQEQASRAAATGVEAMTTLRNIWSEEQAVAFGTVSMGPVHGAVDTAVARLRAAGANALNILGKMSGRSSALRPGPNTSPAQP